MMAAATAFGLSVPHEDTMDMSSPARHDDGDIDIDFDEDLNYVHDEQMVEDADVRPATATDAEMDDDMLLHAQVVHEEEMSDPVGVDDHDHGTMQDDELIDYDEDDVDEAGEHDDPQPVTPDFVVQPEDQEAGVVNGDAEPQDAVDVENAQAVEASHAVSEDLSEEPTAGDLLPQESGQGAEEHHAHHTDDDDSAGNEQTGSLYGDAHPDTHADAVEANEDGAADEGQHEALLPVSVDTTAPAAIADGPATPTDTGLHPVILYFNEQEIPLFKSKHHSDGLLKNDNLASLSLAELMKHCKTSLADRGEEIPEQKEAVLSFDHLALILHESSRAAYECSLNDVLDTFLQLYLNDGVPDIPPMFLALSLQLKFSSSLDFLKRLAATGHGISNVPGYQQHESEDHDAYEQPYEETGEETEDYHEQHNFDHGQDEHEDEYQYEPEEHHDNVDAEHKEEDHQYGTSTAGENAEHEDDLAHDESQLDLSGTTEAGEHGLKAENQSTSSPTPAQDDAALYQSSKSDDDLIDYTYDDSDDELTPDVAALPETWTGDEHETDTGEYTALDYIDWDDLTPYEAEVDAQESDGGETHSRTEAETEVEAHGDDGHEAEPEAELREYEDDEEPFQAGVDHDDILRQLRKDEQDDIFDHYPDDELHEDEGEVIVTAVDLSATSGADAVKVEGETAVEPDAAAPEAADVTAGDEADELIDYDDDTTEEHNQKVAAAAAQTAATPATAPAPASTSPLGKRSFEDDEDLIFDEEPTPKKPRAV